MEASATVRADAENLELAVTVSLSFAGRLLDPQTPPSVTPENFAKHRPALLAAAGRVGALSAAAGHDLVPARVLVTIDAHGGVRFLLLYPPESRPARLSMVVLNTLPPGYFCLVADETTSPARRLVLLKDRADCTLGAAASAP